MPYSFATLSCTHPLFSYNLIDVKVGRSYYIQATAPEGYLFSGGVCNDEYVGWECEYSSAEKFAQGHNSRRRLRVGNGPSRDMAEATLGIPEGRSQKCVTIDPQGIADRRIDLGVIRVQDARLAVRAETGVELALSVDAETEFNMDASDTGPGRRWRSLMEGARIREAPGRKVELGRKEMEAIGEVTAEGKCVSMAVVVCFACGWTLRSAVKKVASTSTVLMCNL